MSESCGESSWGFSFFRDISGEKEKCVVRPATSGAGKKYANKVSRNESRFFLLHLLPSFHLLKKFNFNLSHNKCTHPIRYLSCEKLCKERKNVETESAVKLVK